jgi:cyclopropane fatty-acyl-phospholipid synthase-like methyltransferase
MMSKSYNSEYYSNTYDSGFVNRQQQWLTDYLEGRNSGFTTRINFILKYQHYIKGQDLLDLGCGIGTFALILAKQGYQTVGLDISENSIEQCQINQNKIGVSNAKFVLSDCAKDSFAPNSFDSILAADIIEHLPPKILKMTLANCYKWLRPNGTFIIHTFPTRYYYMMRDKYAFLVEPIRFLPQAISELYLNFMDKVCFNLIYRITTGQTHQAMVEASGHCNPPHPWKFKKLLEETGFRVLEYQLLEEILSGIPGDEPRYSWCRSLMHRQDLLKSAIMTVVTKPADTKA